MNKVVKEYKMAPLSVAVYAYEKEINRLMEVNSLLLEEMNKKTMCSNCLNGNSGSCSCCHLNDVVDLTSPEPIAELRDGRGVVFSEETITLFQHRIKNLQRRFVRILQLMERS